MAGVNFTVSDGGIATTTSTKTVLQLKTASNHAAILKEAGISFQGVTNSAAPIKVELLRQSTAGTAGTTPTQGKHNPDDSETIQTVAKSNFSSEPTAGTVLHTFYIHPQSGQIYPLPILAPLKIPGNTYFGMRVTAGADISCAPYFTVEE